MSKDQKSPGGLLVGQTDKNGGPGIKIVAPEGDILMGGGELVLTSDTGKSTELHEFDGKKMTPCEIASELNQEGGGVKIPCHIAEPANTTDSNMEVGDVIKSAATGTRIPSESDKDRLDRLKRDLLSLEVSGDGKSRQARVIKSKILALKNKIGNSMAMGGGVEFIEYKDKEIMFSPKNKYQTNDAWFSNDREFSSLDAAKAYIDKGAPMSEKQINAYRHGAMEAGGKVDMDELSLEIALLKKRYPNAKVYYYFAKTKDGKGYILNVKENGRIVYSTVGRSMSIGGGIDEYDEMQAKIPAAVSTLKKVRNFLAEQKYPILAVSEPNLEQNGEIRITKNLSVTVTLDNDFYVSYYDGRHINFSGATKNLHRLKADLDKYYNPKDLLDYSAMAFGGITKDEKQVLMQAKNIWREKKKEAERELSDPNISDEDRKQYVVLLREANQHIASFENGSFEKGGNISIKKLPDNIYWAIDEISNEELTDTDFPVHRQPDGSFFLEGIDNDFVIEKNSKEASKKMVWNYLDKNNLLYVTNAGMVGIGKELEKFPIRYLIYVVPQSDSFKPHVWVEGGLFVSKDVADRHAAQTRKMKDAYKSVEVVSITDPKAYPFNEIFNEIYRNKESLNAGVQDAYEFMAYLADKYFKELDPRYGEHVYTDPDDYYTDIMQELFNVAGIRIDYSSGGKLDKTKLKYAKKDINLLEKEHNMAITDTEVGVLWGSHRNGIFEFTSGSGKNMFKGNKESAIDFLKGMYTIEEKASGGEISGFKNVKASQAVAMTEVLKHFPEYKNLNPMEAGMLYALRNNPDIDDEVRWAKGLKEQIYKKLEDKYYIVDFDLDDKGDESDKYRLSDRAIKFIQRVDNRLETRKDVKKGYDLFPETSNIPELAMASGGSIDVDLTPKEIEDFNRIHKKYADKDYFGTKQMIENKEEFRKQMAAKGDELALKTTKEDIERMYRLKDYQDGLTYFKRIKRYIKDDNKAELKKILRANQKMTIEFVEAITGKSLKGYTNQKALDGFVDSLTKTMAKGGGINTEELDDMLWVLRKDGPTKFYSASNIAIAEELVERGLVENTGTNEYAITKKGEMELMEKGGKTQLQIGIEVEKEHKDLYERVKKMFEANGMKMPISEKEFYKTIAKAHIREDKYYYDKLLKYVEGNNRANN